MLIKISKSLSSFAFPYHPISEKDRQFILSNLGQNFNGERVDMNYYRLANGVMLHIYNGTEVSETPTEETATIYCWACSSMKEMGYKHNQKIPLSSLWATAQEISEKGFNVMILDGNTLCVDTKRFGQR